MQSLKSSSVRSNMRRCQASFLPFGWETIPCCQKVTFWWRTHVLYKFQDPQILWFSSNQDVQVTSDSGMSGRQICIHPSFFPLSLCRVLCVYLDIHIHKYAHRHITQTHIYFMWLFMHAYIHVVRSNIVRPSFSNKDWLGLFWCVGHMQIDAWSYWTHKPTCLQPYLGIWENSFKFVGIFMAIFKKMLNAP